jgi:hypothetical protein
MEMAETSAERRKAQELTEDLMRLKRVEQVYVSESVSSVLILGLTLRTERSSSSPVRMGISSLETLVSNSVGRPEYTGTSVGDFWSIPPSRYAYGSQIISPRSWLS